MSASGKKTRGRQKIEMKKIENEDDKLITFSKRRSGIYKKASELATLCGAELAVLVYSPAGKPFSFGHPSVESVINRYLNQSPTPNDNAATYPIVEAHRKVRIDQLTEHYNELHNTLDAEKETAKVLDTLSAGDKETRGWWETPSEQASVKELEDLYSSFANLRTQIYGVIDEKKGGASSSRTTADDLYQPVSPAAFPPSSALDQVPSSAAYLQVPSADFPPANVPGFGFGSGAGPQPF